MPFASISDLMSLLRNQLLSNTTVHGLCQDRVLSAHPRDADARTIGYPTVILELGGGSASPTSSFTTQAVRLYGYSRVSEGEAGELYDACFEALHHQKLRRDGISSAGYAMETLRPQSGWNEQAQAYWCQGTFTVRSVRRGDA